MKFLPPALGLLVLTVIILALHGALRHVSPGDVLGALAATPKREFLHALMLLALSCCFMALYDLPGVLFARRLAAVPRLSAARIAFTSFCAYALSHVLGAPALSAAAIRVRLYAQWAVPPAGIARIVAVSGSMFSIGLLTLLGLVLLLHPMSVPLSGRTVPGWALRAVGAGLVAAAVFYITGAQSQSGVRLFGRSMALPGRRLACLQLLLAGLDIMIACGIFFAVLPDAAGLVYPHVLAIYLAAFGGGLISGLPAGVGVFDTLLLLGLADYLPAAAALGAILLFRVLYFLAPACAAALCYAVHEVWITMRKRKI